MYWFSPVRSATLDENMHRHENYICYLTWYYKQLKHIRFSLLTLCRSIQVEQMRYVYWISFQSSVRFGTLFWSVGFYVTLLKNQVDYEKTE